MKPLDKNYLLLQFQNRIYKKDGTEFQSFFEDIMEKAFSDFQTIRPYGSKGDGGNDGYRKESGIYFQVYAPITPKINEATAAGKLEKDFEKLKKGWNKISEIKEYIFVFNDKYGGSVQLLEDSITKLQRNNPKIKFNLFLARDLEQVFFKLDKSDILALQFDIDQRRAVQNAYSYLDNIKIELDRENAESALRRLSDIKHIVLSLNDESLCLEYEILECRCSQKLEKIDEVIQKYKNISKRFPNDPRALLYLSEIYLNLKQYDKNLEYIKKAENIDREYWLLKLEKLVRNHHLEQKIDTTDIDENSFPEDLRVKGNFYRLYALFYEYSGDQHSADSFIEKAIHFNPDRFSNYFGKLDLLENRLLLSQNHSQRLQKSKELLKKIKNTDNKFFELGSIGPRKKALLNAKKLNALRVQENFLDFEKVSKEKERGQVSF